MEGDLLSVTGSKYTIKYYKLENEKIISTTTENSGASKLNGAPVNAGKYKVEVVCNATNSITYRLSKTFEINKVADLEISSLEELKAFRDSVNHGTRSNPAKTYEGQRVVLTKDIDMKGENWEPIGGDVHTFTRFLGTFDGQNHVLYNMTINSYTHNNQQGTNWHYGLFGNLYRTSVIKNLGLENIYIIGNTRYGGSNLGGICGTSDGSVIENCYVTGKLGGAASFGTRNCVGGIVGCAYDRYEATKIKNCYTRVSFNDYEGNNDMAGILGTQSRDSRSEGAKIL